MSGSVWILEREKERLMRWEEIWESVNISVKKISGQNGSCNVNLGWRNYLHRGETIILDHCAV